MLRSAHSLFAWWPATVKTDAPEAWRTAVVGVLLGVAAAVPALTFSVLPVKPYQILVVVAVVIAAWPVVKRGPRALRFTAIEIIAAAFVALSILVQLISGPALNYRPDFLGVLSFLFPFLGFFAARCVVNSRSTLDRFLSGVAIGAPIFALVAFVQALWPAGMSWLLKVAPSPGVEARLENDGLFRAGGFVGHWTGLGYYLTAMLLVLCILLILRRDDRRGYVLICVAILALGLGLTSALTLAPYLTSIAVIVVTLFNLNLPIKAAIFSGAATMIVGIGSLAVLPGFQSRLDQQAKPAPTPTDPVATPTAGPVDPGLITQPVIPWSIGTPPSWLPSTVRWRWNVWENDILPAVQQRPWTGWGDGVLTSTDIDRVLPSMYWHSAESQWFWAALSRGIPAAIVLFGLIVVAAVVIGRNIDRVTVGPLLVLLTALVLFTGGSFIAPIFTNHGLPLVLWPLVGAVLAGLKPGLYALPFSRTQQRVESAPAP